MDVIETTLLRGKVKLLQPKVGFHASIDSVFLAAAVHTKDRQKVLDVGCGAGSVGLCILSKKQNIYLIGIDIQRDVVDLARQNSLLNQCVDKSKFIHNSIKTEKEIDNYCFDHVVMNPPYLEAGTHSPSPNSIKATSHGEDASTLEDWIKYAHKKLKSGARLTLIHRADRLDDVIHTLVKRRWFGSLVIYPLWSHAGEDAKRIIVQARKERYGKMILKPGMIIHRADGKYTPEAEAVLSDGALLPI